MFSEGLFQLLNLKNYECGAFPLFQLPLEQWQILKHNQVLVKYIIVCTSKVFFYKMVDAYTIELNMIFRVGTLEYLNYNGM